MIGPKQRKPEDKKVCLGCYEKVAGRGVDCPGCKWPMCGKKVCWEEGFKHALGECALLKGARERLPANYLNLWDPGHVYQSLTVLRFLSLRERDPSKWRELMSLKLGISSMKLNGMNLIAQTFIVPIVNKYLLNDPVPEEWIIKLITLLSASTLFLPALKVWKHLSYLSTNMIYLFLSFIFTYKMNRRCTSIRMFFGEPESASNLWLCPGLWESANATAVVTLPNFKLTQAASSAHDAPNKRVFCCLKSHKSRNLPGLATSAQPRNRPLLSLNSWKMK